MDSSSSLILKTKDVVKKYGGLTAVSNASLVVQKGGMQALIGPNGAGKTTLLDLITGQQRVTEGQIFFKGEEITKLGPAAISKKGIARTLQITSIFVGLTVYENIWIAVQSRKRFFNPFVRASKWQDVKEKTEYVLELIGLQEKAKTVSSELSYGDQRILEIGIGLSTDPELLLLDEPTAGLSTDESMILVKKIRDIIAGRTIILVEHDMGVVMDLADRISVLHNGVILTEGTPQEIKDNEKVREVYLGA